jgi:hypothetical protein
MAHECLEERGLTDKRPIIADRDFFTGGGGSPAPVKDDVLIRGGSPLPPGIETSTTRVFPVRGGSPETFDHDIGR